jgi:PAS domain S-box-containing protein
LSRGSSISKSARTILVVDDTGESSNRYKQQFLLDTHFSYQIVTEPYTPQILARCCSQQIDAILLDFHPPDANSLNFLSQLKAHLGESCPPVVVIDSDDVEMAVQAFKNGAADYLVKDRMTPEDLRLAMGHAIENAESKRELQRQQAQFQTSVENMRDCFGIFSALRDESGQIVDFRIDYLNEAACENNCMTKDMQLGRGLCEVLPNHRESGLFDEYCQLVETGEPLIKESLVYEDTYGEQQLVRAFDIRATKLEDGFVASWRDVTSYKRLELELSATVTELRQEQNRLQRLINTAPIGIGIGSANGEVMVINDAMLRLHGLTREEFEQEGMNWLEFIPPEENEQTEQEMAQFRERGSVPPREKVLIRRDGTRVPAWISGMRWIEGTDNHVAYAVDLTQLKQTEAALQRSQQRYQALAEAMPQMVWTADATGAINYWNQRWYDYTGLSEAESMGLAGASTIHPEDRDRALEQWSQSVAQGEPFEIEYQVRRHDGVYRWFICRAIPMGNSQEQITNWIGTITDLEQIKQSETAIQRSEQHIRRVLNSLFSFVGVMTPDGILIEANQTALEAASLAAEDVLGKPFWEAYWWSYSPDVQAELQGAIEQAGQGEMVRYDCLVRLAENHYIIIDFALVPLFDSTGVVEYLIPSGIDITGRVETEAFLRESQAQLQQRLAEIEAIYQTAPIGLNVLDRDLRFVRINEQLAQMNGLSVADHIGRTVRELLPEIADTTEQLLRSILETGEPLLNVEITGETPAQPGVKRTWLESFIPLKYGDEVIGISTVCEEITERKQAEQALRHSEERYRTLFETMEDGFCVIQLLFDEQNNPVNYRFLEANPAFKQQTGLQQAEGKTIDQLIPDLEQQWFEIYGEVALTGKSIRFENVSEVMQRWFDVHAFRIGEPAERKVALLFKEISERKQAEDALRKSEDRFRMAIESAQLGTWDWNLVTNQLIWDKGCKAMFGLDAEAEITIDTFFEGLHPDDRDRLEQVLQTSLDPASGGNYDTEYRIIGIQDGVERWIAAKGKVYFDSNGTALRFVGTVLNITEQKRSQALREQLLQHEQSAREEAERANRIKDEFLANLSHELRTPLNPILGWAKLLQSRKFNETKTATALATIERNARLQSKLIDDLLDVARILRGKLVINERPTDLASVVENAIETVRTAAEEKSISLVADLSKIGQVLGDQTRLQQIVWNLLSNAIKFTPSGGSVEVRLAQVDNAAQITVTDTGKGISADFLPRIFESFRQQDASITRQFGGLGLGLAIVHHLVEAHGGTITVHSTGEGQGTTFSVTLPLLNFELENRQEDEAAGTNLDLTGVRILAVDDEPDARDVLAASLTHYGAEVRVATSAAEALEIFSGFQPDILVSDIGMPEVDGYILMQQIRALPTEQGGKVGAIALTAYAKEEERQQALNSGYQAHIAKPLEPDTLVQAVAELVQFQSLGGRRQREGSRDDLSR